MASPGRPGRFVDTWTAMEVADSPCVWTAALTDCDPELLVFPSAHGEGRLVADPETIDSLERSRRVALRYADNFNGSAGAIAGVCDAGGRVLGLMPHPERYLDWDRHPSWTRLDPRPTGPTPGMTLFASAVDAVSRIAH